MSFSAGFAAGLSVGKKKWGSGGGDVFLVSGSESGITVTMVKNRGETQELTVEMFTFNTKTYKTITSVGSGKTTIEKTWSKNIITKILKNDDIVWKFTLDSGGNAAAVLDSAGNDVLNGITGEDGKSVLTTTPEGIALGWALAYNNEQNSALQKAIDAYKDGIDDCDKINEAEGVDCNCGCGCGDGDGDGSGDGTGDGSGGVKLPPKSFGKFTELPRNDDGSITIPTGSGAFREDSNGFGYAPDCIIIDVSKGADNVSMAMYNNDRSSIKGYTKGSDGEWKSYGRFAGNYFAGGYKLNGDGALVSNTGTVVKLSGDIYYVT